MSENIYTRLINREFPLPADYVPDSLTDSQIPFYTIPSDDRRLLQFRAAIAARKMILASQKEGLNLFGISGYRSYERQKKLYSGNPYVAPPGASEHQSGLALDLSCPDSNMELTESFASTKEGLWLKRNASLYGFIIRYPQNKEDITGYPWEPWHIRYVTKPLASWLSLTNMTLEEFHQLSAHITAGTPP